MTDAATLTKPKTDEATTAELTRCGACYRPNVDILEQADELVVLTDMPGANPEDIDIDFKDGMLTIHGKIRPRQEENTQYLLREYGVGDYWRTFQVSEAIDASKITAEYTDGVLTLHLPKAEATRPRKISVKAS